MGIVLLLSEYASLALSLHWMGDFLQEEEQTLCGNPRDEQKCARRDFEHQERAEIVIVGSAEATTFLGNRHKSK
jgi:hypothetical protein